VSDHARPRPAVPEQLVPRRLVPEQLAPARLLSDERLARLASAGSTRAFATLYERHHQALYRYCLSIVRNREDAQDALQSALANALAALSGRERELAVRPWLFRIAHNEAVTVLRRRRPESQAFDETESAATLDVEGTAEQRERLTALVADIQQLPLRQRASLVMRELSGLSIDEIAGVLSISPGAAKQTLFEARSSLHAFAEGRAMECEQVRLAISDDGRAVRARKLRAHLRACPGCRDFHAAIGVRKSDLRALAPPLPAVASAATLTGLLARAAGSGHSGGALAGAGASPAAGAGAGSLAGTGVGAVNHAAQTLLVKGLVGAALVAGATVGTVHLASSRSPAHDSRLARAHEARRAARASARGDVLRGSSPASRRALGNVGRIAAGDARRAAGALAAGTQLAGAGASGAISGREHGSGAAASRGQHRGTSRHTPSTRSRGGARSRRKSADAPGSRATKSPKSPTRSQAGGRELPAPTPGSSGEAHVPAGVESPSALAPQSATPGQPTTSTPVTTPARVVQP
jgi:RNA polymerase sigma factor (sigma-70 family)